MTKPKTVGDHWEEFSLDDRNTILNCLRRTHYGVYSDSEVTKMDVDMATLTFVSLVEVLQHLDRFQVWRGPEGLGLRVLQMLRSVKSVDDSGC